MAVLRDWIPAATHGGPAFVISMLISAAIICAWLPLLGASTWETIAALVHFSVFYLLPGFALVTALGWDNDRPEMTFVWAISAGVAIQPALVAPLWMFGFEGAYYLIPLFSVFFIYIFWRRILSIYNGKFNSWSLFINGRDVIITSIFISVTIFFCVYHAFSTEYLDAHFSDRERVCENGIRQGQDRAPGHAKADHWDEQAILRSEQMIANEASRPGKQVKRMQAPRADLSGDPGNYESIKRGDTILDGEHDADPIASILVGF